MDRFRRAIGGGEYRVIFTSGASESSTMIIRALISRGAVGGATTHSVPLGDRIGWRDGIGSVPGPPHVIASSYEHKSILSLLHSVAERGECELSEVDPDETGHISPARVAAAIRPNTVLVCVMHANNETGAVNDVDAIAAVAHAAGAAMFSDTAQTFGKIDIPRSVDAYVASFHKIYGPPGVGAAIIRESMADIVPMIHGMQNGGLRGGTENMPGIAASAVAWEIATRDRSAKNARLVAMKRRIVERLAAAIRVADYPHYVRMARLHAQSGRVPAGCMVVLLSGFDGYLPGTLLMSILKFQPPAICNVKLRRELESMGVIVGIGSACNTQSKKASHVLYALGADRYVRAGALRVSLCDFNTRREVERFCDTFLRILSANGICC
jgi:cysteine desulfurase